MPDNKNQHYVPQFYLRNFASTENKRSINLYNLDHNKVVLDASLRGQCSKGYFYGKSSVTDDMLTSLETISSIEIHKLVDAQVMPRASKLLRLFISIQKGRTLYAVDQAFSMVEGMKAQIEKHMGPEANNKLDYPSRDEMKDINVRTHVVMYPVLMDLCSTLLVNETKADFITSDNPVVVCNRFFKDKSLSGTGLGRSGIEIYLPISPRLVVVLYDGNIWHAPNRSADGTILLRSTSSVTDVNALQVLNCHSNIYFADVAAFDTIEAAVEQAKARRRPKEVTVGSLFPSADNPNKYSSTKETPSRGA